MNIADGRDAPEHRNGTSSSTQVDESSKGDRRMVFFVLGSILLAFTIGLCFLILALMLDWQK
jgi:hypothetical protein